MLHRFTRILTLSLLALCFAAPPFPNTPKAPITY